MHKARRQLMALLSLAVVVLVGGGYLAYQYYGQQENPFQGGGGKFRGHGATGSW